MRLLSCHVDNFGKWADRDFDLTGGINSFFMSNGEGKTTLAAFIKAMLYGLEGYTEKTKDFVERRRYAPFEKGTFGGNIIFEHNGEEYRIERCFHEKSKAKDELRVYCNGSLTDALGDDPIGERLFGLDETSFTRTLFVTAEDAELCATSGIGASLNGYGESSIDVERADKLLESAIKKYKLQKGVKGLINDTEKSIKNYRSEIENYEKVDAALGAKYAQRKALVADAEELQKNISSLRDTALLLQKWKNYDAYLSDADEAKKHIDEIGLRYPKGMPSDDGIAVAEKALDGYSKVSERLAVKSFGAEKQKSLDELDLLFESGAPTDREIEDIRKRCDNARECEAKIKALDNISVNERDAELLERFAKGAPSDEALAKIRALEADHRQKSARLTDSGIQGNVGSRTSDTPKKRNAALPALIGVGGLSVVVGIALAVAVSLLAGMIAIAVGAVAFVGVGFAYILGKMNDMERGGNDALAAIRLDVKSAESDLRAALALEGYGGESVLSELARMYGDIERYREILSSEDERARKREALIAARDAEKEDIKAFLTKYSLDVSTPDASVTLIERRAYQWTSLLKEKEKSDGERREDERISAALKSELDSFFASYRDEAPSEHKAELIALKNDSIKLKQHIAAFERAKRNADEYKEKEGLSARPSDASCDVSALEEELSAKKSELLALDAQISEDEEYAGKLDGLRAGLEAEEEKLNEYKSRHKLLSDCRELLRMSDNRLTERYIAPVKNGFQKYARLISESLGENITLDRALNVSFEKNGTIRDSRHLSAGQRAVWALCLRLAFMEELFGGDMPFLILDDPFVSLDAENMSGVARLLAKLSKETQIIYFTCHESRRI